MNPIPQNHSSPTMNLLSFPSSWNHLSFYTSPPTQNRSLREALASQEPRRRPRAPRTHPPSRPRPPRPPSPRLHHQLLPPFLPQCHHYLPHLPSLPRRLPTPIRRMAAISAPKLHIAALRRRPHGKRRTFPPPQPLHLAVSWHGIAYETIHSDIVQDLLRLPNKPCSSALADRLTKVLEEVKFFRSYAHHVATSDHVGDVLKRVYLIPEERVHIIVNGVDEDIYKPQPLGGRSFRTKVGVPEIAWLVIGMAGRLVKDKGHPVMFEALKQAFIEDKVLRESVFVLVAGDGPWGSRYKDLDPNLILVGSLDQTELSEFYSSLDVFTNPTLRAQGLDHTFVEAMLSGVPVMGTRFASITGSIIVGPEIGYTFQPTEESVKDSIFKVFRDGREILREKGAAARRRAVRLFTATKMAAAYERLLLCISDSHHCSYPLPGDGDS